MSLGGLGGAGLDSPLGQAFRLIETMYWQAEVWFMVAMLLIALVVILLVVTGWLGFSLQRLQSAFRKLTRSQQISDIASESPKWRRDDHGSAI